MIGIDASRAQSSIRTGTETYSHELIRALADLRAPDSFELYFNAGEAPSDFPELGRGVFMPFPKLWTHLRLSARMVAHPPGVLLVPAHVVPLVHPKTVAVVHDLGYLHVPDAHPASTRKMLDVTTRWSVHAARRVIAISRATKRDLIEAYGVPAEKIVVIHHGVSPLFRPMPEPEFAPVLKRHGIERPYLLAVGTYQPRKNYGRLAEAMSYVESAGLPHNLVIAGKRGWLAERVDTDIEAKARGAPIHRLGYVDSRDLPALYAGADAFCMPSLYEGFGMPVIEAMASGVAVVTSNSSALAEIAGDAALTVDPRDAGAIGRALVRILMDRDFARSSSERGFVRAADFTWEKTARATLDVLRSVRDGNLPSIRRG